MKKRNAWLFIMVVFMIIVVCVFNMRFISHYAKQILNQNIKESPAKWNDGSDGKSFESTYCDEDMRLAGLKLGITSEDVRNLFGAPLRTRTITVESPNNSDYNVFCTYWNYSDLEVGFQNSAKKTTPRPQDIGHLFMITVKTAKFQSYRRIKVGDPVELVKKRYGLPSKNIYDDLGSLFYERQLTYIKFGQAKGKVSEIELAENAD